MNPPTMRCASMVAAVLLAVVGSVASGRADTVKCQRALARESAKFLQKVTKARQKCEEGRIKAGGGPACPDTKTSDAIDEAEKKLESAIDRQCGGDDKQCGGDLTNEDPPAVLGFAYECPDLGRRGCSNPIADCGDVATCLACVNEAAAERAIALAYGDLVLPTGDSEINKCQRTIGKEMVKFLTAKSKILQRCWDARLKGEHESDCAPPAPGDGKYLAKLAKIEAKKVRAICKACGGEDKGCDGNVPASLIVAGDWRCSGGTNNGEPCSDLSHCPDQGAGASCGVPGTGGSDDLAPAAIGFSTSCPELTLPFGSKRCVGGTNAGAACTADSECPSGTCSTTQCRTIGDIDGATDIIDSLGELVLCVDCVTESLVDCADAGQVPALADYPRVCNSCVQGPPTSGPCPASYAFTVDSAGGRLDSGWTGLAHDTTFTTNLRMTLAVSGCDGTERPNCGQCTLSGLIENAGGAALNNHRCEVRTWIECSDDTACEGTCSGGTNAGEPCNDISDCPDQGLGTSCSGSRCIFFLGPPLALAAGGVTVCVVNQVQGTVAGTVDVETGEASTPIDILSRVYPTGPLGHPCPLCQNGVCTTGERTGQACTVNGTSAFGDVSFDCPPAAPGQPAGFQAIRLGLQSGTEVRTLSAASPNCRATGYTGLKCLCDTCNNAEAEACATNADCPDPDGGGPYTAICGGKRCIGGTDNGAPCTNGSGCPGGGLCNVPGQGTAPNACFPPDGPPDGCVPTADNEGECVDGPVDSYCSVDYFRGCTTAAECSPPLCADCVAGQTCLGRTRECYTDNGVIGGTVVASGRTDPPCEGTYSAPILSSLFCIPPSGASSFNIAAGEPGLGRIVLPGKAVAVP